MKNTIAAALLAITSLNVSAEGNMDYLHTLYQGTWFVSTPSSITIPQDACANYTVVKDEEIDTYNGYWEQLSNHKADSYESAFFFNPKFN